MYLRHHAVIHRSAVYCDAETKQCEVIYITMRMHVHDHHTL